MAMLALLGGLMLLLPPGDAPSVGGGARPMPELLVDEEFQRELELTISATWDNVGLRAIARRMTDNRRISIILDRRLDPSSEVPIDVNNQTVRAVLEQIAARVSARPSFLTSTVYMGPDESAAKLRTLIALRTNELFDETLRIPRGRRFDLDRPQTLRWNDLDRPVDLVRTIAEAYSLEVSGLDLVPHDLWASATLPAVNAIEALSLILIQFDLTFAWSEGAGGIRIVPAPRQVYLERTYSVRRRALAETAERLRSRFPELRAETRRNRLFVRGTLEQHEAVDALLNPKRRTARGDHPAGSTALSQQEFSFRVQGRPARAIFQKLEDTGVKLEYDATALAAAGIDLDKLIDMNVKNVSADEFFQTLCDPLGLKFSIDGATVRLQPK